MKTSGSLPEKRTIAEVAEVMGVTRRTALRRMRALEDQSGRRVLLVIGPGGSAPKYVVSEADMRLAFPERFEDLAVAAHVSELQEELERHREGIAGMFQVVSELSERIEQLEVDVGCRS